MKPINEQISTKFVNQAKVLSQYTALLRKILPAECLEHVAVANIRDQNLILITDSPVWTTRLRQLSPQILQAIQAEPVVSSSTQASSKIHHVQISTRYQYSHHNRITDNKADAQPKPKISNKTAELLSLSADSIQHQPLKAALFKLASHASSVPEKKHKK